MVQYLNSDYNNMVVNEFETDLDFFKVKFLL